MTFVRTRISVAGFTEAEVRTGLPHLLAEFEARPWIVRPAASWDASRRLLVVTTHYEGDHADFLGAAASDEVWDCVFGCFSFSSGGINFEVEESVLVEELEPDA